MCKRFSTSGLLCHLKNAHKELDIDMKHPQKTLDRKLEICEEIASNLAMVDGFSINVITKSEFIRKSIFQVYIKCFIKNLS